MKTTEWNHDVLSPTSLETYAAAIHHKAAALESCFGFYTELLAQFQGREKINAQSVMVTKECTV